MGYHTTTDGLDFRDPDISQSTVLIENRMQSWRFKSLNEQNVLDEIVMLSRS